jgi:hypothetical protein
LSPARYRRKTSVSKSPIVIAVIGLAGCVAMSLMMRHLLSAHQEQSREPLELALERRFSGRLAGPARVLERVANGRMSLVLELRVLAGMRKDRFVDKAGLMAWEYRRGCVDEPHEVEVIITDDGDGEPMAATVPRPRFWR